MSNKDDIMKYAKNVKLLPCPFCGGAAEVTNSYTICHKVQCSECDALLPDPECSGMKGDNEQHIKSVDRVAGAWNRRV